MVKQAPPRPPPPPPPPKNAVAAHFSADEDITLSDVDLDAVDDDIELDDEGDAPNDDGRPPTPPSQSLTAQRDGNNQPSIGSASAANQQVVGTTRRVLIVGIADEDDGPHDYNPRLFGAGGLVGRLKACSRLSDKEQAIEAGRYGAIEAARAEEDENELQISEGDSEDSSEVSSPTHCRRLPPSARDTEDDDETPPRPRRRSLSTATDETSTSTAPATTASSSSLIGTSFANVESCRGWMQKFSIGKSSILKFNNWKRRFFVLAVLGDVVSLGYYEDEACRKLVGAANLNPLDTRLVAHPSLTTHRKAKKPGLDLVIIFYEVTAKDRKELRLLLRCDSTEEHRKWVNALREVIPVCDAATDFPIE